MDQINSRDYWDERFLSGNWEETGGEAQSDFFASLALSAFPAWLNEAMQQNDWRLADHGCAEGSGTALLAKQFPRCKMLGTDFSSSAIEIAGKQFPFCSFQTLDLMRDELPEADVVFSSNVLEHVPDCCSVFEKLVQSAARYAVILVPFEDASGIPEHIHVFDIHFFPETVGERHYLRFFRVLDCRDIPGTHWAGKQLLLIYANRDHDFGTPLPMAEIYENSVAQMIEQQHQLALQLRETQDALRNSQEWNQKQYLILEAQCREKLGASAAQYEQEKQEIAEQFAQEKREISDQCAQALKRLEFQEKRAGYLRDHFQHLRTVSVPMANVDAILNRVSDACSLLEASFEERKARNAASMNQLMYRIATVRKTPVYRAAHLVSELAHLFLGSREDRRAVLHWLLRDRGSATRFHYLHEFQQSVGRIDWEIRTEQLDFSALQPERIRNACLGETRCQQLEKDDDALFLMLDAFFARATGDFVFIMPPVIDWNVPLFQRPQQLAMALSKLGVLCFYGTSNYIDAIDMPLEVLPNCVLVQEKHMEQIRELARAYGMRIVLDIWSTDNFHYDAYLSQWQDAAILYEYIDEISEEITGHVPPETRVRHANFLASPSVYVVATAEKLYREVLEQRGSGQNVICSGNGVDLEHFQVGKNPSRVPENLQDLVLEEKPIIGYFGAIANWVDYDLLIYAAEQRPDYRFLLIGPHYGGHELPQKEHLAQMPNVCMPGTIAYQQLPYVAQFFTVATIPFVLNEITESTSPIKLFEYMSMGTPVVTTAMPECCKYPEVRIGHTQEEYVEMLDRAVAEATGSEREAAAQRMIAVAEQNSWMEKAREIIQLLNNR